MTKWLSLITGGIAGTAARYVVSGAVYRFLGASFPYGTLVVNLIGCFVVGFLAAVSEEKFLLTQNARLLLMAGFCGAFTTFSTWMLETSHLMKDGQMWLAFWNLAGSVVAGFLIFRAGMLLGRII